MNIRELDIVVISDVHLGTYGCKAKELLSYLNSIKPKMVILNGDIIDIWQFNKWYFPKSHLKVIQCILNFLSDDIPVYYLTGNHDDMFRTFTDFNLKNFHLLNKLILNIENNKTWIFHGDFLDITVRKTKWLAKLGTIGYHALLLINWLLNWVLSKFGKPKFLFSQRIKASVKGAVKSASHFEETITKIAIEKGYKQVICGHNHKAEIKQIPIKNGYFTYLNSGDWVESLTALEYSNQNWRIYNHLTEAVPTPKSKTIVPETKENINDFFNKFT